MEASDAPAQLPPMQVPTREMLEKVEDFYRLEPGTLNAATA